MINSQKAIISLIIIALLLTLTAAGVYAEDAAEELDNAEEQQSTAFWIQVGGGAVVAVGVVVLLIINRDKLTRNSRKNGPPVDEDKTADKIRLADPSFKRDTFKAFVRETMTAVLAGMTARDPALFRRYESDELYSDHEKHIRELTESGRTLRYEDVKPVSFEIADYTESGEYVLLMVKAVVSTFEYTFDDRSGSVLDGSRLAKRNLSYRLVFMRKKGLKTSDETPSASLCPACGKALYVTPTGKCSECKAPVCGGDYGWILNAMTKWRIKL